MPCHTHKYLILFIYNIYVLDITRFSPLDRLGFIEAIKDRPYGLATFMWLGTNADWVFLYIRKPVLLSMREAI
jgi:hypothetical protein